VIHISILTDTEHTSNRDKGPFLNLGLDFIVNMDRVTSILPYTGAAVRKLYSKKLKEGLVMDCTRGRKKRSLVVLDTGEVMGCVFSPDTIASRQI
jgi:regulator of extracellular matrix RemA (YlzA/DUF370 family)